MNITAAFPSKNLKASDIEDGDMILTMSKVEIETVGQGNSAEQKPVLYFRDTEKSLVLNKTNSGTIAQLYGNDTDNWNGGKIALFATEVDFQGKQTLAIRVRMKKPNGSTPAPAQVSKAPEGNAAPGREVILKARKEAWQAFIDATPDFDEPTRTEKWKFALKVAYPTTPEKNVSAEEWYSLAERIKESYDQATGDFLPF